jgi:hypothetical protein
MMMSKPNSEQEKQEEEAPAFASAPAAMKTGTVEDLERRLAMLGKSEGNVIAAATTATAAPPTMKAAAAAAAAPAPPPTVQAPAAAVAPAAIKGGKNALLVRRNIFKKKIR